MQHQRVGELIQQARRQDYIVWVTRIPNRAVDVVSRPQTPILWAEPIERSILDGCEWLRRKRFQSKLSGRPSSGFHSPYRDRPIGVGAVFRVARIYPHNRTDRTMSCEPSTRYSETLTRVRCSAVKIGCFWSNTSRLESAKHQAWFSERHAMVSDPLSYFRWA
jgi:hypothetical protein